MVRASGKTVSEVCSVFQPVPQVLKNVRCRAGDTLDLPPVRQAIDEAIARLGESGRLVIRPSGTEPLIRVMAEGDDERLVNAVVDGSVAQNRPVRSRIKTTMTMTPRMPDGA
jgi:phosphoglucosamine mutase